MNILDQIVADKRKEILLQMNAVSMNTLERSPFFSRPVLSFKTFLKDPEKTGIIAEFKRRSPSKGLINGNADVIKITKSYAAHGASALSVLTDKTFFGGSAEDLAKARINELPILRKDFMLENYQILEAKAMGADIILLIAACLTPEKVRELALFAKNLGLEVLLEIHNKAELNHLCDEVDVAGINNRDLKTFSVDINRSIELAALLPAGKMKIAESGIRDVETIIGLRSAGFDGFLIGEQFMKEADPSIAFASFINQLKFAAHESESLRHDTARPGNKAG